MTSWDKPDADILADMREVQQANERSLREYVPPDGLQQVLTGGEQRVSFMRAEHAPTPGNFASHGIDISGVLAGVRKASASIEEMARSFHDGARSFAELVSGMNYRMPSRPNDRRTVHVLGKAKHWYADLDGQLRLAEGESPWTGRPNN